jgi:Icc protein
MTVGVLQVSDIHVTSSGHPQGAPDPEQRLDAVLAAAVAQFGEPDLVVASGDLTDDGSADACARLAERLQTLGAPVLAVAGNHDDPAVVTAAFGEPVASVGGWQVIGVDTSRPQQIHGSVDVSAERTRFERLDERPALVVLHHPPTSPSTHEWFQLEGGAELCACWRRTPRSRRS